MARSLPILIILASAPLAAAQRPGIELRLVTRTLEPSEAVQVQLVCTNTGEPDAPETVVPQGLDLRLSSNNPSVSSMTSIINGRMSKTQTYTFHMLLTALTEGTYTIGPISVVANGTRYETEPLTIVVRKSDDPARPRGDRYIYAEMHVQPTSVYVSESYTASLTIGIRKVELGGRIIDMNLLNTIDARASRLSVFADGRFRSNERWITDSTGQRHEYVIYGTTRQIRAEEVGETMIGPIFLKANYPTRMRRSFFSYEVSQSRKETARADAVTVEVKGPPVENRPPSYTGAIGRYTMEVKAKPTHVEQGRPVTLTLSIKGLPIEGVAGPDLNDHPELASRFDYARDELVGEIEGRAKIFRRAIFPKQQGEQTIPPISWSYFDTRREQYVTLTSDAISLTVDPPSAPATTIQLADQTRPEPTAMTLTALKGGISPNYVDPHLVLAGQAFALRTPGILALVVLPVACLLVSVTTRHRARLRADAGLARRRRARRAANTRIVQALRKDSPADQLEALSGALIGYLWDRFNLPPGAMTPEDAHTLLVAHGADEELAVAVSSFMETCDSVRYAPSTLSGVSVPEAAAKLRAWIKRIEGTRR